MLNKVVALTQGKRVSNGSFSEEQAGLKMGSDFVEHIPTNEQRVIREERLRELMESDIGKTVLEEWQLEVLFGWSKTMHRKSHAIKLTNNITGESIAFLKNEIENMKNTDKIVDTLRIIGEVERNHIRFFGKYINAARRLPDKVTVVDDLAVMVSEKNSEVGFSILEYYKLFIKDYFESQEKYPSKSSNQYQKYISHGVILDSDDHEYFMNGYGYYPVAIRTGKLKQLFPHIPDQEYRQVFRKLYHLGVLHDSIALKIERDANRFDRRIKMVEMQTEKIDEKIYSDNVFIFNIIPPLLEGRN